ncbi:MAG: DUF1667 domain-containing protein [Candidatus Mcinerneyibacterium aminivorans]|uniref:DUF1667 domain-containing protein n=1 Tax=Candidatus Mcinerneyibacterium aminivorans TaxID=2703815 RepID=A0A5D0MC86_9BACT|nr:MAG: DUF1667 domain-containing protein [Candidatus Mcinerneyibacterium aminivorans]
MSKKVIITCINCPMGCEVELTVENEKIISIEGNRCPAGKEYVKEEYYNPTRILTTTMRVKNGVLPVIPVKSSKPIPKNKLKEAMIKTAEKEIEAPIRINEVLIENIVDTEADIVASRSLDKNL